jgi:hypothetical protein
MEIIGWLLLGFGNPKAVISDGQDNRKEGRKVSLEKEY